MLTGNPITAAMAGSFCAGVVQRGATAAQNNATTNQIITAALNPKSVATDLTIGATIGVITKTLTTKPTPSRPVDDVIRRADAHLTGSGETVLGHYADDYIGLAQQRGASYFDIGDARGGLSDAQRWVANRRVLDAAVANGDRITLATARANIRYPSALADEIQYLTSNGYTWLDDVTLVPG